MDQEEIHTLLAKQAAVQVDIVPIQAHALPKMLLFLSSAFL